MSDVYDIAARQILPDVYKPMQEAQDVLGKNITNIGGQITNVGGQIKNALDLMNLQYQQKLYGVKMPALDEAARQLQEQIREQRGDTTAPPAPSGAPPPAPSAAPPTTTAAPAPPAASAAPAAAAIPPRPTPGPAMAWSGGAVPPTVTAATMEAAPAVPAAPAPASAPSVAMPPPMAVAQAAPPPAAPPAAAPPAAPVYQRGEPRLNPLQAQGLGDVSPWRGMNPNATAPGAMVLPGGSGWSMPIMDAVNSFGDATYAHQAFENRSAFLGQLMNSVPDGDNAAWNRAVTQARQRGYITNGQADQLWNGAGNKQAFIQSLLSPEHYTSLMANLFGMGGTVGPGGRFVPDPAAIATRGAIEETTRRAQAGYSFETVKTPVPGKPGQVTTQTMTTKDAADWYASHPGSYSGGSAPAPVPSGATRVPIGNYNVEFTAPDGTKTVKPVASTDLGKAFSQGGHLISDKGTPVTSSEMTDAIFAAEASGAGAGSYAGARGRAQITEGTFKANAEPGESFDNEAHREQVARRYINKLWNQYHDPAKVATAYFSGEGNVATDPKSATPWKSAQGDRYSTVPGYVGKVLGSLGISGAGAPAPATKGPTTTTAAPGTPATPATPAPPAPAVPPAPATPAPPAAEPPPGRPTGVTELTEPYASYAKQDYEQMDKDATRVTAAQGSADAASTQMLQLNTALRLLSGIPTGNGATWRAGVSSALNTYGPDWAKKLATFVTDRQIDPAKAADMQEFGKMAFMLSLSTGAAAGGMMGIEAQNLWMHTLPNMDMQKNAINEMFNFSLVANQMVRDRSAGMSDFFNTQRGAYEPGTDDPTGRPARYKPLAAYEADFTRAGSRTSPQTYSAAVSLINGRLADVWAHGLTFDQKLEAIRVVQRATGNTIQLKPEQLPADVLEYLKRRQATVGAG